MKHQPTKAKIRSASCPGLVAMMRRLEVEIARNKILGSPFAELETLLVAAKAEAAKRNIIVYPPERGKWQPRR